MKAPATEGNGFKIDPCPPADPQKKGIVEARGKHVKGNFLPTHRAALPRPDPMAVRPGRDARSAIECRSN